MAIVRYADPADPPTADADWTSINNQIELLFLAINLPFRVDYAANLVKKGATFYISGTKYLCNDDTAITGTASPYVKLLPSGDGASVTASYVASLTGVTWSSTYNGYYDAGTPASMYYFDEHLAMAAGVITVCRTERNTNFYNHDRVAIGSGAETTGVGTTSVGYLTEATGNNSSALGRGSKAGGNNSLAIGYVADASGANATAVGLSATATGIDTVAIRGSATSTGAISIRGGASGVASIAIGMVTSTTLNEVTVGKIKYVEFTAATSNNTVFDLLYDFLGSSSTLRSVSCIGSIGATTLTTITVNNSTTLTLSGSGGSKTITDGSSTAIGSAIKLILIKGITV